MAENRELALVLKLVASQFQDELKKSGGMVGEFQKFIGDWRTQLTLAGTALFAVAKSTANYGDELVKASQRMGTSIADTARLQHAAKLSDTDLSSLTRTVGFLSKQMLEASQGNAEAKRNFDALGLSVTTSGGQLKGTTQILLELNDKFRLMPEGPEKTALALRALGKSGAEALPLLNSNLREAFTEAEKFGLVMDEKAAKAAEHFNDELTKLQAVVRGITSDIGNELIPKFDAMVHALTTIATDARAAARAIANLDKIEAPQVGVVQPESGGRRLRVVPAPSADVAKEFQTTPFFKSPERAASDAKADADEQKRLGEIQEKFGKAKLDIFLMQNRALEIQARLRDEADNAEIQQALGAWIVKNTQETVAGLEQEQLGRQIIQQTQAQLTIEMARQTRQMSEQEQLGRQIVQQTQAQLAIEAERQRAGLTFFDEWKLGMDKYVRDTKTGLGLGADMARRTAQMMEQSFRQFFFDVWDGKIKSMKDVLEGLADFAKQVMGTVFSQLATKAVLTSFGFGVGAAGGGELVRRFAMGGPVLGAPHVS